MRALKGIAVEHKGGKWFVKYADGISAGPFKSAKEAINSDKENIVNDYFGSPTPMETDTGDKVMLRVLPDGTLAI